MIWGGGGGGGLEGMCRPILQILTLFQTKKSLLSFFHLFSYSFGIETIRDCAIIIRREAEKLEGGALHKIAAKIGGLKVKSLI